MLLMYSIIHGKYKLETILFLEKRAVKKLEAVPDNFTLTETENISHNPPTTVNKNMPVILVEQIEQKPMKISDESSQLPHVTVNKTSAEQSEHHQQLPQVLEEEQTDEQTVQLPHDDTSRHASQSSEAQLPSPSEMVESPASLSDPIEDNSSVVSDGDSINVGSLLNELENVSPENLDLNLLGLSSVSIDEDENDMYEDGVDAVVEADEQLVDDDNVFMKDDSASIDDSLRESDNQEAIENSNGSIDICDIYSTRSYSESHDIFYDDVTSDYDPEKSVDDEIGEDPLSTGIQSESEFQKSLHSSLDSHSSRQHARCKSKSRSNELTDTYVSHDSWVELKGPTVSKMYVTLTALTVSTVSVWCLDNWGNVFFSQNTRGVSLKWDKIPGKLTSLQVSDSGLVVWGVTYNKRAVVRIGINLHTNPSGTDWSELMLDASSVAVDDEGVWLKVGEDRIYFRSGVTPDDPQGERWRPVSVDRLRFTSISISNKVSIYFIIIFYFSIENI